MIGDLKMSRYKLYQPALLDHQIRALYWLKEATGLPMTFYARLAVDQYLKNVAKDSGESMNTQEDSA